MAGAYSNVNGILSEILFSLCAGESSVNLQRHHHS